MPALKSSTRKPVVRTSSPLVAPLTLEGAVVEALARAHAGQPPVPSATARLRDKRLGDRRVKLEFYPDSAGDDSILMRVKLASPANEAIQTLQPQADPMLSTQEAASLLLVSRPYVTKLVDQGSFSGIVRTEGGHRRIPQSEVLRVRKEMKSRMRQGIVEMLELAEPALQRELQAATQPRGRKTSPKPGQ